MIDKIAYGLLIERVVIFLALVALGFLGTAVISATVWAFVKVMSS